MHDMQQKVKENTMAIDKQMGSIHQAMQ